MLCLGKKSFVVILNYVRKPCSPDNGPGPVPWLGKVREHHVFRKKQALSPNSRGLRTFRGGPDPRGIPDPHGSRTPV